MLKLKKKDEPYNADDFLLRMKDKKLGGELHLKNDAFSKSIYTGDPKEESEEKVELLNQGGYGCVYYPAIKCRKNSKVGGKTNVSYVSKIQFHDKSSKNEIEMGQIVKTISNYNNFFAPVAGSCGVNINRIDKDLKDVYGDKCGIYEKKRDLPFIMVSVPYIKDGNFNKNVISSKKSFTFVNIVDSYKHLLNALLLMNHAGIVHYDLKSDNVLYDTVKKQPIVIDFGLSIDMNKVKKMIGAKKKLSTGILKMLSDKFYVFAPDYYLWCIEIHIISYLMENSTLDQTAIQNICYEYVENNRGFILFDDDFKNEYMKSSVKFFSQYIDKPKDEIILSLLKHYETWDNFSLSLMFLKLAFTIFKYQTNNVLMFFYQILIENINPDPTKRNSVSATQEKMFSIYNQGRDGIDEILKLFVGNTEDIFDVQALLLKDDELINSVIDNALKKKITVRSK